MFGEYSELILVIFLIFMFGGAIFPLVFIATLAHELGHCLMAKACGICVYKISIFGGTPLWSFRIGETLFVIAKDDHTKVSGYVESALIVKPWHSLLVAGAGAINTLFLGALYLVWLKIRLPLPAAINNSLFVGWWTILTLAPAAFLIVSGTSSLYIENTDGQKVFAALFRIWEKFSGINASDPVVNILLTIPLIALVVCYGPVIAFFWLI